MPQLFNFVFQCEIDPAKQVWLAEQFPDVPYLFADASTLSQPKALNIKSGQYVQVPSVSVLLAGFSCKSRSKLNSNSASNRGCVREGREETGLTYECVRSYVSLKKPSLVILENVVELQEGGLESDLNFILDSFSALGYQGEAFEIEARHYGSFPQRKRLYFVMCKGPSKMKLQLIKGILEAPCLYLAPRLSFVGLELRARRTQRDLRCARVARSAWQEMQCHSRMLQLDDFLMCETDMLSLQVPASEAKVAKKESNYERHHEELFLSAEWEWPLSEARFVRDIGPSMLCFSQRAREVVYVAHMKWEMLENVEAGCFEVLSALRSEA